jgi:ATP-dependent Clp protease ATP-binding subunit ClpC
MTFVAVGILFILIVAIIIISPSKGGNFFKPKNKKIKAKHYPKVQKLPTLDMYAKDLTRKASLGELDPVVGRDNEISRAIRILSRRTKNNPILIGKSGVGKTAIVEGLAQILLSKVWDEHLRNKRVLSLDLAGLLAGTKFRGEFEKRLQRVTQEIIASQRSIILFIDEIHTLAQAGEATGGIGASDILKPALARGDLQVIGATTPRDYEEIMKKDTTLTRRFQIVNIKEPSREEAIKILEALKPRYGKYHQVEITREAIVKAVDESIKHIKDRHLPDKAIDLMDETASAVKLHNRIEPANGKALQKVLPEDVEKVIEEWGITGAKSPK